MSDPGSAAIAVLLALAIGAAVLVLGLRLGMLVAPRLTRWAERDDEEPGDRDDPDA